MVKTYVDFELNQPLEKTVEESLDEIVEEVLVRVKSGSAKEIQALAKAVKDIAIARAVLSKMKSWLHQETGRTWGEKDGEITGKQE